MLAPLLVSTSAANAVLRDFDRFNGFESGGPADYIIGAGDPVASANAHSGDFGLLTSAAGGSSEYLTIALSQPSLIVSDGIWLCRVANPSEGRRIRAWFSGSTPVVELFLRTDNLVDLRVNSGNLATSTTAIAACPAFTHVEVQYQALASGGNATLRVNGITQSGTHNSTLTVDSTRIGPDDGKNSSIAVAWDDHTIARTATFPGALQIVGLAPRNGASAAWARQGDCTLAADCVDDRPPDGDTSFISSSTSGQVASFCHSSPSERGVFGQILGLKTIIVGRRPAGAASVNLTIRLNASACGGSGGAGSDPPNSFAFATSYLGLARTDLLNFAFPNPWTLDEIATLETVLTYPFLGGSNEARVTQVLREVAFDTTGFASPTPTITPTGTPTHTPTPTPSSTPTSTATATATPSVTPTPSATATPTATPTGTTTHTPTSTSTPTATNSQTVTATATATASATPSFTPTVTPTPTRTATPTATPTITSTATATATPTKTRTSTPTVTGTPPPTATSTVTATPTAPQQRAFDRMNGFESGTIGDYSDNGLVITSLVRSGQFALRTSGTATGFDFASVALSTQSSVISDGIYACRVSPSLPVSRRVRTWLGASSAVVELLLNPDWTMTVRVAGSAVGRSTTAMTLCPTFTHYELQYLAVIAGGGVELRVDGHTEVIANHGSSATISRTLIGTDTVGSSTLTLVWDDHTISRSLIFPAELRIVGVVPSADGTHRGWSPDGAGCGSPGNYTCVNTRPPTGPGLSTSTRNRTTSFCHEPLTPAGVIGRVLAAKFLVTGRESTNSPNTMTGLFLRTDSTFCGGSTGIDSTEVAVDLETSIRGFARIDELNPVTLEPWTVASLDATEIGVRHSDNATEEMLAQLVHEVAFDPVDIPTPTPSHSPTMTSTDTPTPTSTATTTPTFTATDVPTASFTATFSSIVTATPTRTPPASATRTATFTASTTPTGSLAPTATETASATRTASSTATATGSVSVTRTATVTPSPSGSVMPTDTPTQSITATPSTTGTPTNTGTPPTATSTPLRLDFVMPRSLNQVDCAFARAAGSPLLYRVQDRLLSSLAGADPALEQQRFKTIYLAPDLRASDYDLLRTMSAPGGFIERFVALGGVAVLNLAGAPGSTTEQMNVAPDGVGYLPAAGSNDETILQPAHPYITGLGFGGLPLGTMHFHDWNTTDGGTLTNVPGRATVVLENAGGPSWAEYTYGAGRVIVTSLAYCWTDRPDSDGPAMFNLLRYSQFFSGLAQTPAPSVTPTFTPTATPSMTPTVTSSATVTASPTRTRTATPTGSRPATATGTPSPTPTPILGDINNDAAVNQDDVDALIAAIFVNNPFNPRANLNHDEVVSGADLVLLMSLLR